MKIRQTRYGVLIALLFVCVARAHADGLARLEAAQLAAAHADVMRLQSQRNAITRPGPFIEIRANLHVHSKWSHDSRGTLEEIVAAAKKVGTQAILFSEHPADHYDFYVQGHRGVHDGVLLIPGAEMRGFLIYPTHSLKGLTGGSNQEFSDLVRRKRGLTFVSHLEERMDWSLSGLTGVEIYNTHADFKDEKAMQSSMRNPLWLIQAAGRIRQYPQEAFSALQDYPADYLARYDVLCTKYPHTGVAANDAHQNVGLIVRSIEGNKARIEDALGKKIIEVDEKTLATVLPIDKTKANGDILFQLRLDPYEQSLRHVGTHLLVTELSERAVWDALEAGRAFVAFDWIADSTGFDFSMHSSKGNHPIGSKITWEAGQKLVGQAPLAGTWRVKRDGKTIHEETGARFSVEITTPGIYRAEVWLRVGGEDKIWILSNPIYVK